MDHNEDELQAPNWVNADFIRKVIESSDNGKNVKIKDYKITPGTGAGDHFASIMFRINVEYSADFLSNKKIAMILKTLPVVDGYKKETLDNTGVDFFGSENYMYNNILNECQEILDKCGYKEPLAPKLLYSSMEPPKVLVFEDLKELGYFMLPANLPNEHETKLIFSKLAQFHAITFKMGKDGRNDLFFKATIFGLSIVKTMDFLLTGFDDLAELLEKLPGFESHAKKMRQLNSDTLREKCTEIVQKSSGWNVLNHGDFHIRNMMFKKNEFNAVSDVILLDFQFPHWGSPAYDLIYMTVSLPPRKRKIAIRHYYNIFADVLAKMGYKGDTPTFDELEEELKIYSAIELFFLSTSSVFFLLNRSKSNESINLENFMTDRTLRKSLYANPIFVNHVKEVVPRIMESIVV